MGQARGASGRVSAVDTARALVPALAERATEAEGLRSLPAESVRELKRRGLTRLLQPREYGGASEQVATHMEVCAALAHGCVSTAWCTFVWGIHNHLVALFPQATKDQVWGTDPSTLISASLGPVGNAEVVEGGVMLSGRWGFNSGCDHARYLLLGAMSAEGPWLCLVPSTEYTVIDNWHVVGLRGTGSKDAEIDRLFVPLDRALRFAQSIEPNRALLTLVIAGPVLGAAEAALERYRVMVGADDDPAGRQRLARLSAETRAARLLLMEAAREIDESLASGDAITPLVQLRVARDTAFASTKCQQTVNEIFAAVSGRTLHDWEPLQRIWRDITAGCSHARLRWDMPAEAWAAAVVSDS